MKSFRNDPLSALVEAARTDLPSPAQLKALGVEFGQAAGASAAAGATAASAGGLFGSTAAAVKVVGIACALGAVTVGVTHQEQVIGLLGDAPVQPIAGPSLSESELSDRQSVHPIVAANKESQQGDPVAQPRLHPQLERREVGQRSQLRASRSGEKTEKTASRGLPAAGPPFAGNSPLARSSPVARSGALARSSPVATDFPPVPRDESQKVANQRELDLSEIRLIEDAHQALASDPARALAISQQHQQQFSHGRLSVERRVLTIKALFQLGRTEAAHLALESFSAAHPGSVHLPHLRQLLAPHADKIGTNEH